MTDFEHDGVAATRRAASILVGRGLPSFPRTRYEDLPRWRLSPDVVVAMRSLYMPSGEDPAARDLVDDELFGYPVDVDEAAPAWTIELGESAPVVVTVVVNGPALADSRS